MIKEIVKLFLGLIVKISVEGFMYFKDNIAMPVIIAIACKILHVHAWNYYGEKVKVTGLKNYNKDRLNVPLRKCALCGKREHHLGMEWRKWTHESGTELKLETA